MTGKLDRIYEVFCGVCADWRRSKVNASARSFRKALRAQGWRANEMHGWLCPTCCSKEKEDDRDTVEDLHRPWSRAPEGGQRRLPARGFARRYARPCNLTLGTLELHNGARWFRTAGHVAVVEVHPHPVEGTQVLWCTTQINLHVLDK